MQHRRPRLEGKVAIVTGAGASATGPRAGTGKAISITFAREGAKVLLVDRSFSNAADTHASIQAEGGEASVFEGDVTNSGHCAGMVEAARERYGRLDILVNNAGIFVPEGPGVPEGSVVDVPEDLWDKVLNVNLKSMMLASKYAIPEILKTGGGAIINLSSIGGLRAGKNSRVSYNTSKGGVIALTSTMAAQHGRDNIRVNCIAPGAIDTPMASNVVESPGVRSTPLGTLGTAWDVAWAAVYLASDEARWVTGIVLPVDAGSLVTSPAAASLYWE